jgi:hypothetical protein
LTLKSSSPSAEAGGDNILVKRKSLFSKRKISTESEDIEESQSIAVPVKVVVDYDGMTVASLKDILRERGLQVSGLKEELKTRLKLDDSTTPSSTSTKESKESDNFDNGVFSSSEKDFLGKLPGTVPEVSTSSWVTSSSETAFNDRKFKDQRIQEENKAIVRNIILCIF